MTVIGIHCIKISDLKVNAAAFKFKTGRLRGNSCVQVSVNYVGKSLHEIKP